MDDWRNYLERGGLTQKEFADLQLKALESHLVYEVKCFYELILIARFVVRGIGKEDLISILKENFLLFNINSEGSGLFYFRNDLSRFLAKKGGFMEPVVIEDYRDLPITSFEI